MKHKQNFIVMSFILSFKISSSGKNPKTRRIRKLKDEI